MLFELDGSRVLTHSLFGQLEKRLQDLVQGLGASQGLEQELAADGSLAVRQDFVREHCLLDDLSVDLNGALTLGKLLFAVHHEVIDSVQKVAQDSLVLDDHIGQ